MRKTVLILCAAGRLALADGVPPVIQSCDAMEKSCVSLDASHVAYEKRLIQQVDDANKRAERVLNENKPIIPTAIAVLIGLTVGAAIAVSVK